MSSNTKRSTLRLIQFDQLNEQIGSLQNASKQDDIIALIEPWEFLTLVPHHKKKVVLILAAMRKFAQHLQNQGWKVEYYQLQDAHSDNTNFTRKSLKDLYQKYNFEKIYYTLPSDYHWQQTLSEMLEIFECQIESSENNLFLTTDAEFTSWAKNRKEITMEYFYRQVRRKYHILMEEDQPVGGQWNFDKENRSPPPNHLKKIEPFHVKPCSITQSVIKQVIILFPDYYGSCDDFHFATCHQKAQDALTYFIRHHLEHFGKYQDIMMQDNPWLHHSHLSFYLNIGLLSVKQCVDGAQKAFYDKQAPLNSVEGFIRQVIGWREFIRGIYL